MCGPTVYDHTHIGHARTYVCFDIIHRILTDYFGHTVFLAMGEWWVVVWVVPLPHTDWWFDWCLMLVGLTDVDDKIITRAGEKKLSVRELAGYYERDFFDDMNALGVRQHHQCMPCIHFYPGLISLLLLDWIAGSSPVCCLACERSHS